MGGGWSPFEIVAGIVAGIAGAVGAVLTGGALTGVLIAAGTLMVASTVEGAVTGRLFASPMAFLFEPTRLICKLLGITDKDITQGNMSVSKVFHENQYKDTLVKNHIAREKDGTGVVKYFYDFSKVGQAQFDKYFLTGKKKYVDGLPSCNIASTTVKISTVNAAIKASTGRSAVADHTKIGYPDDTEWAQWILQQRGIYKYSTDLVTIDNRKYYMSNVSYNINTNKINVTLTGTLGNNHNTSMTIDPPAIHSYYVVVFHYTGESEARIWIHSTNLAALGTNFANENPDKMIRGNIDCLPIVCLRNNKIDVNNAEGNRDATPSFRVAGRYKKAKQLLASLGLPIDDVIKQYKENGSINDVYDVYFMAGVSPIQTMNDAANDPEGNEFSREAVARYLYTSISRMYDFLPCVQEGQPYFLNYEELPLKGQVVWAGVPIKNVKGKKCKYLSYAMEVGNSSRNHYRVVLQRLESYLGSREVTDYHYDSEGYSTWYNTYTVYEYSAQYVYVDLASAPITPQKIIDNIENMTPFYPDRSRTAYASRPTWGNRPDNSRSTCQFPGIVQFTSQPTNTLPYYRILRIVVIREYDEDTGTYDNYETYYYDPLLSLPRNTALNLNEYVTTYREPASITLFYQYQPDEYKQLIARSCASFYYTECVDQDLLNSARGDDGNFVFPISYQGLKNLSVYEKTKFLSEGFYLMFFAKQTQHLEFYQTPEFAAFLQIVGICIVVLIQVLTWWSGPTASMTAASVLESLIESVATYVAVTLALKVIAAVIPDSTLKAILSAAVLVAAVAVGGGFSNFNFSTAVQLAEVPVKAIDIYTKDQMKYAQQDMLDLNSRYQEALKTNESLIGQSTQGLDVEDVLSAQSMTREWGGRLLSIDEFYTISITCPDLYDVCQGQIDRQKTTDLDDQYPLFRM